MEKKKFTTVRLSEEGLSIINEFFEECGGKEIFGTKENFLITVVSYAKENISPEDLIIYFFNKTNHRITKLLERISNSKGEKAELQTEKGRENSEFNDADILMDKLL